MAVLTAVTAIGEQVPFWIDHPPGVALVDNINQFPIGPNYVLILFHVRNGSAENTMALQEFPDSKHGRASEQLFTLGVGIADEAGVARVIGPFSNTDGFVSSVAGHGEVHWKSGTTGGLVGDLNALVLRFK